MTCDEVKHPEDEDESTPRSKKLLALLAAIRKHARNRALYLNFLPKPDKVPLAENPMAQTSIPEPEAEEPAAEDEETPPVKEVDPDDAIELDEATGAAGSGARRARRQFSTTCRRRRGGPASARRRTPTLQKARPTASGTTACPIRCGRGSAESRRKVLGEGGYREAAARRLRAQVQLMETLIAKTPRAPFRTPTRWARRRR